MASCNPYCLRGLKAERKRPATLAIRVFWNSGPERSIITSFLHRTFFLHKLHKKWNNRTIHISQQNRDGLLRQWQTWKRIWISGSFSSFQPTWLWVPCLAINVWSIKDNSVKVSKAIRHTRFIIYVFKDLKIPAEWLPSAGSSSQGSENIPIPDFLKTSISQLYVSSVNQIETNLLSHFQLSLSCYMAIHNTSRNQCSWSDMSLLQKEMKQMRIYERRPSFGTSHGLSGWLLIPKYRSSILC